MEVQATCPIHNVELEAKTGQFGNYWSHTIPNVGFCDGKKIKPFKTQIAQPVQTTGIPTEVREPIKQRDYDAEARGKIRSLFLEAKISRDGLIALSPQELVTLDELVEIAMGVKND